MKTKETAANLSGDDLPPLEINYETGLTPLDTQSYDIPFNIEWLDAEEDGDNEFYNEMLNAGWLDTDLSASPLIPFNVPNWDNSLNFYPDILSEYFWPME